MTDAPERILAAQRIWVRQGDMFVMNKKPDDADEKDVEYIRADIAEAQLAAARYEEAIINWYINPSIETCGMLEYLARKALEGE